MSFRAAAVILMFAAQPASAAMHGSAPSGIQFNLIMLPSAQSAPAGFQTAVQNAAAKITAAFPNTSITLNIRVGYDEFNDGVAAPTTGLGGLAQGASLFSSGLANQPYSSLRTTLISKANSPAMNAATSNLPATSSIGGFSFFYVASSIAKALGMISATGTAVDGTIGIGSTVPSSLWVGVALHELAHAMGREPTGVTDFIRFSAPGTRRVGGPSHTVGDYFSFDNGTTKTADYGFAYDVSDFLNGGIQDGNVTTTADAFDELYNQGTYQQTLSAADKQLMNTLGFQ